MIDWKFLMAAMVGVCLAVAGMTWTGSESTAENVRTTLQDEDLPSKIFP